MQVFKKIHSDKNVTNYVKNSENKILKKYLLFEKE